MMRSSATAAAAISASRMSSTASDSNPLLVSSSSAPYQGRNSDTSSATPEIAVIHSPARSLRRSIRRGSVLARAQPGAAGAPAAGKAPGTDGPGHAGCACEGVAARAGGSGGVRQRPARSAPPELTLQASTRAGTGLWGNPACSGSVTRTSRGAPPAIIPVMRIAPLRMPVAGLAFLALADTAIVALALPPILRELDTDVAGVAAVLGVYAVVLALALPAAEWLWRRAGTRAVGISGVALFAGGSLACGLSDTLDVLLIARGVQAMGGAALLVSAYLLLSGEQGGRRMWQLAALLGTAAGPAIGGALTQALGWRSIFFVQAPAALLALPGVLTARDQLDSAADPGERPPARRRRAWHDVEAGGVVRPRWALGRVLALGLISGR